MVGTLLPKVNNGSLPLKSDIGLLIYFILTSKIFSRVLLILTIGWLMRFGINTILTVNFKDPLDLIANIYYFFMVCLVTFSGSLGLFHKLPSIFELYNSLYHGVRLFNFNQYIKAKVPKVDVKPYINCNKNNPTLDNSSLIVSNKDPKSIID